MGEAKTGSAKRALRRLRRPSSGGLESAGSGAPDLTDARIQDSLAMARERFSAIAARAKEGREELTREQERVLADAEAALKRLATEGDAAEIDDSQRAGLEAVIVPDGTRPSLFVQGDDVDPTVKEAGTWAGAISELRTGIQKVARSVGRINSAIGGPNYAGTGFVVADGLIATNRHVLEYLVGGPDARPDGSWAFKKPVSIDFLAEFGSDRKKSFNVTGVAYAGPDPIKNNLRVSNLDLALFQVEKRNGQDELPPPLALSRGVGALAAQSQVYVMGYPARSYDEVGEVLMRVFRDEYFVKRFAPGYVETGPDDVEDGGHKRVFTHDASTLGGNSGSCVVEFRVTGRGVVGLHFGGLARQQNYAHSIARIEQVLAEHGATFEG
jgi:hypothetical protein